MNELVSIIMPVYNVEAFVAEAIESVLAQTYPHWELIIVDDGSTDASSQIIGRYTDPRIIKIQQENKGEGGARNAGLEVQHGTYIGFLDADDVFLPNALADFVSYFEGHPEYDVVFSDGYFVDNQRRVLMRFGDHRPYEVSGFILDSLVVTPSVISVPSMMMVRRSAVEKQGVRFDESLEYGVDWDFWIQLARHSQFGHLPVETCLYRIHEMNMTSIADVRTRKKQLLPGRLKVMNAEWFSNLSEDTRQAFFYNLLIGLLDDDADQQRFILEGQAFRALPDAIRAELLRLMASNHLRQRQNTQFALQCLRQSLALQPHNRKSRLLYTLASRSLSLTPVFLDVWQFVYKAKSLLHSPGRNRPKPVPTALRPGDEQRGMYV